MFIISHTKSTLKTFPSVRLLQIVPIWWDTKLHILLCFWKPQTNQGFPFTRDRDEKIYKCIYSFWQKQFRSKKKLTNKFPIYFIVRIRRDKEKSQWEIFQFSIYCTLSLLRNPFESVKHYLFLTLAVWLGGVCVYMVREK